MKHAYEVAELVTMGPLGRSKLYEKIADGSLKARKLDRKTIVLDEDWLAFLRGLPVAVPPKSGEPGIAGNPENGSAE